MKKLSCAIIAGTLLAFTSSMFGSGFSIIEQSTVGLGRSLAGMTAEFNDPGALYFNPSVGAWHERDSLMMGMHIISASAYFHDRGSTGGGGDGGDCGNIAMVPNLYYIHPIADGVTLNLGLSATSGTAITFDDGWVGRYQALETEIKVVELTPSISWRINEQWAVGAGFIIQDAQLYMTSNVNLARVMNPNDPNNSNTAYDGKMFLEGDSMAFGYTLGVSYKPREGTRLGLGYRSGMTHKASLDGKLRLPASVGGGKMYDDADLDLSLPATVNFGIQQDIGEKWMIAFDIMWSDWSCMDAMEVEFDSGTTSTEEMHFQDAWRYSLGADYKINEKFTWRFGATYDMSPVHSNRWRSTRLPDVDRYWVSTGLDWHYNEDTKFSFAYTHLFFTPEAIKRYDDTEDSTGNYLDGKFSGTGDILSFSMTHDF
ncbi:MAG: outer membrane protein transport protein [Lentisphaeria bacterium]